MLTCFNKMTFLISASRDWIRHETGRWKTSHSRGEFARAQEWNILQRHEGQSFNSNVGRMTMKSTRRVLAYWAIRSPIRSLAHSLTPELKGKRSLSMNSMHQFHIVWTHSELYSWAKEWREKIWKLNDSLNDSEIYWTTLYYIFFAGPIWRG